MGMLGDCGQVPRPHQAAPRSWHFWRGEISVAHEFHERGCSSRHPFSSPLPPAWMGTCGGSRSRHRGVGMAFSPEGQCVCLCFPLAVPAPALALPPQEQIVGCALCSWPSPDVSPRVPAIDGWSKNSPCFPVYARRLPLRSSWIKTARLDKIAFLFIALGVSMVMVERGRVDPNCLLVAVGSVTQGGFAEPGCSWPRRRLAPWVLGQLVSCHTPPHSVGNWDREKGHFTGIKATQGPFFYPEEFFLPVLPS